MKKEFYKLSFVFIMIVFSFSLAFFLGREMTLSPLQQEQSPETVSDDKLSSPNLPSSYKKQSQREKVNLYKKTLSDNISDKNAPSKAPEPVKKLEDTNEDTTNIEPLSKKPTQKKPTQILYTLLIAQYEHKKSAIEKSTQLKIQFPHWKIFFKKIKNSYKVYIGPFKLKESAENFLKELQENPDFSHVKLEEL